MKNKIKITDLFTIFASILLLFVSCASNTEDEGPKTIKIDVRESTPSEILPETRIEEIIPLDSREEALFGNFKWYEVYENRIYILSIIETYSLFVFSAESGKLIAKAKEGKGPEEISRPTACFIDKSKNQVLVYNETSSEIFTYDLDLNFLSRRKVEEYFVDDFILTKDLLLTSSDFTPDYCFRLYEEDNSLIGEFVQGHQIRNGSLNLMRSITLSSETQSAYLITPFDYNIYKYKYQDRDVKPSIYLDFGNYQLNKEDLSKDFSAIIGMVRDGLKVISPMSISTFDELMVIRTFYRDSPLFYLINARNNTVARLNDLSSGMHLPNFLELSIMEDGYMYGLVEPVEMNTFLENTTLDFNDNFEVELDDNPYMVKFKIR